MDSAISFLTFGLQMTACQTLVCTPPFAEIFGVCLHFTTRGMSWCDAQKFCWSSGGELVRGSNFLQIQGKSFPGMPYYYWIGMTDFLLERGLNRNGWRWSDGGMDPLSSKLIWCSKEPTTPLSDYIRHCGGSGHFCDTQCISNSCSHVPTKVPAKLS